MKLKRIFLTFAFAAVAAIALLYGLSPSWFARTFLGIDQLSVDFAHILRAVMCLYLGLGLFWLWAAVRDKHTDAAVITTIVFSGGLVLGRIMSFVLDGMPAPLLIFYAVLEMATVPIGLWVLARPN